MMIAKIKPLCLAATLLLFAAGAFWGAQHAAADRPATAASHRGLPDSEPAALVQEKKDRPADRKKDEVAGAVKEIDLKAGTLKLAFTGDGQRGEQVFNLRDKDMKVLTSLGMSLQLGDLAVGTRVHVQLKDLDILALRADHPTLFLNFASVDAEKKAVSARTERGEISYQVADNAKITVNGKPGKLADVPANQRANVTLSLDRKTIHVLTVGKGGREGEGKGKPREQNATGLLSKVEGNRLTVTTRGDGEGRSMTFMVDKATRIRLETDQEETIKVKGENGERLVKRAKVADAKLADLKAGQRVTVTFADNSRAVDVLVLRGSKRKGEEK